MDSSPLPTKAGDRPRWRAGLKVTLTLLISAGLLGIAWRHVDLVALEGSLARANYVLVAAAVGVYFLDLGLRSLRWQVLLGEVCPVSWKRLYPVLTIGYMANNLLPARIGELSRAYLIARRESVSAGAVVASVALERVIDGLVVLGLLAAVLPALPRAEWLGALVQISGVFFGFGLVICLGLAVVRPGWLEVLAPGLRRLPLPLQARLSALLGRFLLGFAVLRKPGALFGSLLLSLAIWGVGATIYLLVAAAFGIELSPIGALAAICIVNLATAAPLAPAGLGAFEVAAMAVFSLLGLPEVGAAGITIVLHTVLFLPVVLLGLIFLWRLNLSLGSLWAEGPARQTSVILERAP